MSRGGLRHVLRALPFPANSAATGRWSPLSSLTSHHHRRRRGRRRQPPLPPPPPLQGRGGSKRGAGARERGAARARSGAARRARTLLLLLLLGLGGGRAARRRRGGARSRARVGDGVLEGREPLELVVRAEADGKQRLVGVVDAVHDGGLGRHAEAERGGRQQADAAHELGQDVLLLRVEHVLRVDDGRVLVVHLVHLHAVAWERARR